ncbi:GNAT family N-acetyltransferase [Paenibacillus xylaniclasticus]|uniref:GNAT family N-acetyltransferase n=1 Tax=Paenibacillus xylaniclasticus TaxID=588083 RepID=UPI00175730C8|nr:MULTISPECIES: GNAT family N-acetyltransferase [Paenibacillus]GFN30702.1 N-acetyltransferase GCN5 [Paenibacillus curdlanolyticus]
MNNPFIRKLEQLQLNQWPSLQTIYRDGWVLRFADGYSKRANSVVPLFSYSTESPLHEAIDDCESIYNSWGLRPTFKITPIAEPSGLDDELEQRGYALIDRCSVQTLSLTGDLRKPQLQQVEILAQVTEAWLDHYCRLSHAASHQKNTMYRMLQNIRTKAGFVLLYHADQVVACGFGVIEQQYFGLWDIVTDPKFRQRGFGEQLVVHLLNWGRDNGATDSYLVVVANNTSARKLYAKLGFKHVYEHWYRVKENL